MRRRARFDGLGVAVIGAADGLGQRIRPGGHGHQVHVAGQEAVAQYLQAEALGLGLEQGEVKLAVGVGEEDLLAVVAALGDVVRDAGNDDAGDTRHGWRLTGRAGGVKK